MIRLFMILIYFVLLSGNAFSGSIEGIIQFNQSLPTPKAHLTGKFKNICGKRIVNESFLLDDKGLVNVVVTLSGKSLKSNQHQINEEYIIDQKGCKYNPHVLAIVRDSTVKILASDPTNHNIHTYSFDNDPINLMMIPGQDYEHEFEEPELVKVECDLHKWMSAWIFVTDNPFFAISGNGGRFKIKDVPPGKYKLHAWHEILGSISQKINVEDGLTNITLDFSDKKLQKIKEYDQ